jgi:hypothetical protein
LIKENGGTKNILIRGREDMEGTLKMFGVISWLVEFTRKEQMR